MSAPVLPPVGPDLRVWGKNLTAYLRRYMDRIRYKKAGDNPSEDGVFLWDAENGYPVVSLNGEFRQVFVGGNDIEVGDARLVLTSPDGTRYEVGVDNSGNITASPI